MRRLLVACAVCWSLCPVLALQPITPRPAGTISGEIVVGNTPDYITEWLKTPAEHGPTLPLARLFAPEETAYIAFIATGSLPNKEGTGNIKVDVMIAKPDGSQLFFQQAYAHYSRQLSTQPGFIMCEPALDLKFDAGDPLGVYTVTAIFHDLVADKAAIVEIKLELAAKKKA